MKYDKLVSNTKTPQTEKLDERQVENNAGGFVFSLDRWGRLDRFLILGSDSNTYYQTAKALTKENAKVVTECFGEDAERAVARIVEISEAGRAPKNDAALFALAIGAAHPLERVRQLSIAALPKVARTTTHLIGFINAARALGRGWGRSMKRALKNWYASKNTDGVAYQAIKYRQRDGYDHKRLIEIAHLATKKAAGGDDARRALFQWIRGKDVDVGALPAQVRAHLEAMSPETPKKRVLELIREHNLPWEAVPTEYLKDADAWKALLPTMGLTALVRNLGTFAQLDVTKPLSKELKAVVAKLGDTDEIRKSRLHPFTILQALAVYKSGGGQVHAGRVGRSWTPVQQVADALDEAFYKAFENVVPTGKRVLIGLDVSGSMGSSLGGSALTVREAAAAMAMVTMKTEPWHHIVGFTAAGSDAYRVTGRARSIGYRSDSAVSPLNLYPKDRLDAVVQKLAGLPFGPTDCALPMLYAMEKKLEVDVFQIFTDNETWAGAVHPMEALRQYRKASGINAKLIAVGMTATEYSIGDAADPGCLNVVGFDSAAPAVMADFAR